MKQPRRFFTSAMLARTSLRAVALLTLALLAVNLPAVSSAAAPPTLQVAAPSQTELNQAVTVTLTVNDAVNLAGYEGLVRFDQAAAEFAGLDQLDNDVKRAGRDIGSISVPELASGSAIGFYSCPFASCTDRTGAFHSSGASGNVKIASFDILPTKVGTLEIALDALKFVNAAGNPVQVDIPTSTLLLQVGPAGAGPRYSAPAAPWSLHGQASGAPGPFDLTGDQQVTNADIMETAIDWNRTRSNGNPCAPLDNPAHDVNHDGCLDIADLQQIATNATPAAPITQQPVIAAPLTFTVTSTGDQSDGNIGDQVCRSSAGPCTLRAAIYEANAHPGPDTINFNIAGSGVQTIKLNSNLPTLNDASGGTTINGYSQPGAAVNTDPLVSNAAIRIQLVGTGSMGIDGIPITSAGNVVRGLSFSNFHRSLWLLGSGSHDNMIVGNFIGTNAAGTYISTSVYTDAHGIHINQQASRNHIGDSAPADRNVISGNGRSGVGLWDQGTDSNIIINNLVGLSPLGDRRLGNRWHGIDVNLGPSYTIIGGLGVGERNVVSGQTRQGIEISHAENTSYNQVIGNYVGTDVHGNQPTTFSSSNVGFGIQVKDRVLGNVVSGNVVGNSRQGGIRIDEYGNCCVGKNIFTNNRVGIGMDGSSMPNSVAGIYITAGNSQIGPGNIVTNNPIGIRIEGANSDNNTITQNSIYGNTGLGIDLYPIGSVNANDSGDADSGPNQQLNFPVIQTANSQHVTGTACANCTVEIFITDTRSAVNGEGKTFVGAAVVATNGTFDVPITGTANGDYVTSTATDKAGNTSEFSKNVLATFIPPPPKPKPSISSLSQTQVPAGSAGFQLTVNGENFASDAVVRWNGAELPTTVVSSNQLVVDIPASALATSASVSVTVLNRADVQVSDGITFTIYDPELPPPPTPTPSPTPLPTPAPTPQPAPTMNRHVFVPVTHS